MSAVEPVDLGERIGRAMTWGKSDVIWVVRQVVADAVRASDAELAALRARIDEARAAHERLKPTGIWPERCRTCHTPWPCPTVAALSGDPS